MPVGLSPRYPALFWAAWDTHLNFQRYSGRRGTLTSISSVILGAAISLRLGCERAPSDVTRPSTAEGERREGREMGRTATGHCALEQKM